MEHAATRFVTYWPDLQRLDVQLQATAAAATAWVHPWYRPGSCIDQLQQLRQQEGPNVRPTYACRCGLGGWRNGLRFDPFKKYGDWSYVDIMLDPLVHALRSAMTRKTEVRGELFIAARESRCTGPDQVD